MNANCFLASAPAASPPVHELRLLSGTVEDLLSSLASGDKPTSVLKQLSTLQSLVQRRETDKLAEALEELRDNPALSEGTCLTPVNAPSCPHWPFHAGICPETSLTRPCRLTRVPTCPCRLSVHPNIHNNHKSDWTCSNSPLPAPARRLVHPAHSTCSDLSALTAASTSQESPDTFLPVRVFFVLFVHLHA